MDVSMKPDRVRDTDEADRLLVHVGRSIWDNLPQLLFASVLLMIAAYPALFLATGTLWPLAWPVFMLCAGPVWIGIIAASGRLLDGDALTLRAMLALIRRQARTGIIISIVPALVGLALAGSWSLVDRNPGDEWLVVPLLLGIGFSIVVCVSLVGIFTIATERGLSGMDLWLASVGVAISQPVPVLGTLTLFGVVIWITAVFGPVALIALAPLAVLCSAITRDAIQGPST
jgi:hypothetical protein